MIVIKTVVTIFQAFIGMADSIMVYNIWNDCCVFQTLVMAEGKVVCQ